MLVPTDSLLDVRGLTTGCDTFNSRGIDPGIVIKHRYVIWCARHVSGITRFWNNRHQGRSISKC